MKYVHYKAIGATAIVAAILANSACSAKKDTQFVAGLKTQVQVPRDLRSVVIRVSSGGDLRFCRAYPVTKGKAELPQSLGTLDIQLDQALPIEIIVAGLSTGISSTGNICPNTFRVGERVPALDLGSDGDTPDTSEGQIRVFRRSVQQYVENRAIYIPMPIWYSCFDRDCTGPADPPRPLSDPTCKAGRCVPSVVDPKKIASSVNFIKSLSTTAAGNLQLADTSETSPLLKGTGNQCFRSKTADGKPGCFDGNLAPKVIDAAACLFEVVDIPGVPFQGVNVEAIFEGGFVREVLDLDEEEGFYLPDPKNPKRFQLAGGLCDAYNGRKQGGYELLHPITAINVSSTCAPKTVVQPLCYDEEFAKTYGTKDAAAPTTGSLPGDKLKPTASGLVILFDATKDNQAAFAKGGIADVLTGTALKDPGLDPVSIGLTLLPDANGSNRCAPTFAVELGREDGTRKKIRDALAEFTGDVGIRNLRARVDADIGVAGALAAANTALLAPAVVYDRRAVVLIGNGPFGDGIGVKTCQAKPTEAAAAGTAKGIATHVVFTNGAVEAAEAGYADAIANAGGTSAKIDASSDPNAGINAFIDIATGLTTCHYEFPKRTTAVTDENVVFYDRTAGAEVSFAKSRTCSEQSGTGWTLKDNRILLCKDSCTALQKSVKEALKSALATGGSPAATDVYLRQR
jgi:hypothetical protein